MFEELKKQITSIRFLIMLLIVAVAVYLFQTLWSVLGNFSDVFIILISAWVLSFILEPFVDQFHHTFKMGRATAATIVYILFFMLIAAIIFQFIPLVASQIESLSLVLPKYLSTAPPFMQKLLTVATSYLDNSLPILSSIAAFFLNMFLVIIISFYFVVDKDQIYKEAIRLTPKDWRHHLIFMGNLIDQVFGSFLRVQLLFGIIYGVGVWLVLTIFHIDYAASTALLSGILNIIPLIGPILAMIPPIIIPLLTDTTTAIIIFLLLLILQQIIFNIIGPKLLSRAFKLHPIIVILSFIVGYKIAGNVGAIFAIPILGIMAVIIHQLSHHFLGIHDDK